MDELAGKTVGQVLRERWVDAMRTHRTEAAGAEGAGGGPGTNRTGVFVGWGRACGHVCGGGVEL